MNKRTIYIIQDSVSKRYYTTANITLSSQDLEVDARCYSPEVTFQGAVIHTTLNSVREGVKSRIRAWKQQLQRCASFVTFDQYADQRPWFEWQLKLCKEREDVENWGMVIIAIEIKEKGKIIPLK